MSVPVMFAATEGGARKLRTQRELARTLRRAGATSEPAAVPLTPRSRLEERELAWLVREGAIRPGRKGGYWLDEPRWRELRNERIRRIVMVAIVEAGVLAALLLNLPRHGH